MKEILRYTLKEIRQNGTIPYGITGNGMTLPVKEDNASDLYLWLLWAASEYMLATRDTPFLDEELTTYPIYGSPARSQSVRSLLAQCYRHMVENVGTGTHKLIRMLRDDWADGLERATVPENMRADCALVSESVLNSAMASYVFDYYARMLSYAGADHTLVKDARQKAEENRQAVRWQWTGRWFRRAWLGPQLGWVGEDAIWLSPQPWAIVGGVTTPEQNRELGGVINELLRRPSPIGGMQISKGCRFAKKWGAGLGSGTDGAVWPALNWSLIWALATLDGEMAWDEWKKNTLARHAEVYPDLWYGIWSGPDSYRSALNKNPGTNGPDFPVMNMHSHAWPLYSAAKLLGLEFNSDGLKLKPTLPMDTYEFCSPLLGFIKSVRGYEGWYAPTGSAGSWKIILHLPPEEMNKLRKQQVNGVQSPLPTGQNGALEIQGESTPNNPLRWMISS
jgi:hypothetical protein